MNHQQSKAINEIISAVRPELERAGITASLEEQWLTLSTPFANGWVHGMAIPRCAWEMLERNGAISGSAKLVITPAENPQIQAVAEILLESPDALSARIEQAIGDLAIITSGDVGAADSQETSAFDLKELATAAGWDFHCRGDGRLTIALDVPGSSANAILSSDDAGDVSAMVEIAGVSTKSDVIREAAGLFLLQLGGIVRLVRPALCTSGEREVLQLQTSLGAAPTAIELNHALCALSVACRMGQREVGLLLSSESISQRYLSLRGWSAEAAAAVTVASV